MISNKWKIKFENNIIEKLILRYFNIRNFEISKYWSFQILTPTHINLYRRANIRINEIASNAKYRKDEQFQNLTIFCS